MKGKINNCDMAYQEFEVNRKLNEKRFDQINSITDTFKDYIK